MSRYSAFSDDFYVNVHLNTELELPSSRETLLHFFEQIQRRFPSMRNFYCRERSDYVLEEEKERGHYRWVTIEPRRISSGQVNPASIEEASSLHSAVMEIAPFALSVSPLDCESVSVVFGFDYLYRGNHNALVAEALGVTPALESLLEMPSAHVVSFEPAIQLALDNDCRIQVRLGLETRTSAYHVRTGEFPEDQLSVYLTARRYGSFEAGEKLVDVTQRLITLCREIVDEHVVDQVLRPLQQTIALR
jgi:hypothetical protein